jgi:hypothetical protein
MDHSPHEVPRGYSEPATPTSRIALGTIERKKTASRPVSRVLYGPGASLLRNVAAIHLRRTLLSAWCNLPGWLGRKLPGSELPRHPYSVLLPVGLAVPLPLPVARWALTPPFHPYPADFPVRRTNGRPEDRRGGLLSVALSLGSPPPAVNRHRVSMEPGLSSDAVFRHLRPRPPGQLAGRIKAFARQNTSLGRCLRAKDPSAARRSRLSCRSPASPWCNTPTRSGSCAWRHGRHCSAGWCRRCRRRRARAPWRDISCRT